MKWNWYYRAFRIARSKLTASKGYATYRLRIPIAQMRELSQLESDVLQASEPLEIRDQKITETHIACIERIFEIMGVPR